MDLPSPHIWFFQAPVGKLKECLTYFHRIPQSIASEQETHFTAKEVWQWVHALEIHWLYYVPHHPETASLVDGRMAF